MTEPKDSHHFRPTRYILKPPPTQSTPQPRPRKDSSVNEQQSRTQSPNGRPDQKLSPPSIAPIRSLSVRSGPHLSSKTNLKSRQDQEDLEPPDLHSKTSSNLRAAIFRLEFLLHEAARLAEDAVSRESPSKTEGAPAGSKLLEQVSSTGNLPTCNLSTPKNMSRRPSVLDSFCTAKPNSKTPVGLPTVKSASAEPMLTLPSTSTENVA